MGKACDGSFHDLSHECLPSKNTMKKIRSSVFETNSSSMHSICINTGELGNPFPENDFYISEYKNYGTIEIWDRDDLYFGRHPFQLLASVYDKTRYAIASYGAKRFKEIEDIFAEAYNATNPETPFTEFVLPKTDWDWETGKDVNPPISYYGCIDHQSSELLDSYLKKHNITLKEFITNPKYVVVIDGDEYFTFEKYKELGLLPNLEVSK